MKTLAFLVGLAMALALALPGSASAASFSEVKKLTASDAQAGDVFGRSVAISGDTAIAGAFLEDAGGSDAGAAYVFERDQGGSGNWGEVKKLTASDAQAGDRFGASVVVSGDTAIVGANGEAFSTGAAYIYKRDQGGVSNWGEVKKLTASDAQPGDRFGFSVAVSGDVAIVGAISEDAGGTFAGAAYVFERNQGGAGNWGEVTKLTASDAQTGDAFGFTVAINGDTAVVGAHFEDANAGAAYVFERDEGGPDNWGEVTKLTASDAEEGDLFGYSVAISGDTAVVGAIGEDAGGGFFDNFGAAYQFQRNQGGPGNWGEVKKLTASDAQAGDLFGSGTGISGDSAVVGAFGEDAGGSDAGAAYVFERNQGGPGNWGEVTKLTASDAQAGDRFGQSVAISGDTAIVGAFREDLGGGDAGAAYVFQAVIPVGGLVVDLDGGSLAAAQPSGGGAGRLAGTIAGIAALAVALSSAAWYALRRLR